VEAPLLRQRPLGFPLISSHLREYDKEDLLDLMTESGFEPVHLFGMNRGIYVQWGQARESVLIVARRIDGVCPCKKDLC
jgi:hypothetical protein